MFNAIQYIFDELFWPIIVAILQGINNITDTQAVNDNLFKQDITISLFSDTPIVITTLYDISMLVLLVLFSIWFAKFIIYLIKVPFKFFKGLGR